MTWAVAFVSAITQRGGSLGWAAAGACVVATAFAGLRWLRVAQREHYLPDSASRFALRWWRVSALNAAGVVVALAGLVLAARWPVAALGPAVVVASGPRGLGLRGRTAPLRWTRRLRTLAAVWALLQLAIVLAGIFSGFGAAICAAGALAVPALVDVACLATAPVERALAGRYVRQAEAQLGRVRPKIVAITGSFGKTSTKAYVAHLLSSSMAVVASPASFNNRTGLARAVNEHLWEGTDVFVAEMGTYGPGEIAELCSWMPPDIAVITAIGPVHLERFGSEDAIVSAKAEILTRAASCVLVADDPRLAALADAAQQSGKRVWRVSASGAASDPGADDEVRVVEDAAGTSVWALGKQLATGVPVTARPGNVGCAVAVALALDVPAEEVARRLSSLPVAPHRLEPHTAGGGFVVLDDTYNANPAGTRAALRALSASGGGGGRKVVVTPGMVELGRRQADENMHFAEAAASVATDLVVVGRTNRRALVRGFRHADATAARRRPPLVVSRRGEAVDWVRDHLGPGDAVLYENDLPDHYP